MDDISEQKFVCLSDVPLAKEISRSDHTTSKTEVWFGGYGTQVSSFWSVKTLFQERIMVIKLEYRFRAQGIHSCKLSMQNGNRSSIYSCF